MRDGTIRGTVFADVMSDVLARRRVGLANHDGRELDPMEAGRDWLQEAYEECLDMAVYLRAEISRREAESKEPRAESGETGAQP